MPDPWRSRIGRLSRCLFTAALMIPVHVVEGFAVRWKVARWLYGTLAAFYEPGRGLFYFGEDHFEAAFQANDRVLELGSGTGYLARRLSCRSGKVIGIEREHRMVREAVKRGGGVRYVVGDMTQLPFKSGSFDHCASLGAFHCVDPEAFFAETHRVLKRGGQLLVLSEVGVIPLLVPRVGLEATREALRRSGMRPQGEIRVCGIYRVFRACRPGV